MQNPLVTRLLNCEEVIWIELFFNSYLLNLYIFPLAKAIFGRNKFKLMVSKNRGLSEIPEKKFSPRGEYNRDWRPPSKEKFGQETKSEWVGHHSAPLALHTKYPTLGRKLPSHESGQKADERRQLKTMTTWSAICHPIRDKLLALITLI